MSDAGSSSSLPSMAKTDGSFDGHFFVSLYAVGLLSNLFVTNTID